MTSLYENIVHAALRESPPLGSPREGVPVHPEDARQALAWYAEMHAAGSRIRAEAMLELAAWARAGKRAGLSVSEIARQAGVTRVTVYNLLRD
jgi:L-alanine-DL-glutamate epimerase-like enolase superfamily enzyme